jgi:hypothetical protein
VCLEAAEVLLGAIERGEVYLEVVIAGGSLQLIPLVLPENIQSSEPTHRDE